MKRLLTILSAFLCICSYAQDSRPWAIWYWMNATGSKEAVTADLEAMKAAGMAGAYLMPIKGPDPRYTPSYAQLTPEWDALVAHAIREAARTGIELGIHICDGFALAGGPWITPQMSMQKIVSTTMDVSVKGKRLKTVLERPEAVQGWYNDIKVYAYRTSETLKEARFTTNPSLEGFKSSEPCKIDITFDEPYTARSIYIKAKGNSVQAYRVLVEAAGEDGVYRPVRKLEPPRLGWQSMGTGFTFAIPATTAKHWRLSWTPSGSEPGSEDLDAAKWMPSLSIDSLSFSGERKLDCYEGKTALTWAVAVEDDFGKDGAVQASDLIDLTGFLKGDILDATLPSPGTWRIVRIGHTSTGQVNATGGAGKGLECDKFSRDAVDAQLDGWFGHIWNLVDEQTARKAITRMHVDSWECASQNWSGSFPAEFKARRGYDLMPWLPVMTGTVMGSPQASELILRDVRETIAELVHDVFYTALHDRASSLGLGLSAECTAPTFPGDGMLHYDLTEFPMGEFWLRSPTHDKPNDMMDAISGAHIYGKNIIQAEGFTELRTLFDEDPALVKPLLDRNYAYGFNALAFHVWVLNPWMDRRPGMSLDGIGFAMQRDQCWMPLADAFTGYVTRCQKLLQAGHPVTDIAVFTGQEVPRRSVLPDKLVASLPGPMGGARLESEAERLSDKGLEKVVLPYGVNWTSGTYLGEDWVNPLGGYAYDSVNPDVFLRAEAKDGKMVLPSGAEYSLVIFPLPHKMNPRARKFSSDVLDNITVLRARGVNVLVPELLPYTEADFSALGIEPDLTIESVDGRTGDLRGEVAWCHRKDGDRDIYFLAPQNGKGGRYTLSFRVSDETPEIYDPVSDGDKPVVEVKVSGGRTFITLDFVPNESCFVLFGPGGAYSTVRTTASRPLETGTWKVEFKENGETVLSDRLFDWTLSDNAKVKYYSGMSTYSTSFSWMPHEGKTFLRLDIPSGLARVKVNGKPCGSAWTAPWQVDISDALQEGVNTLVIEYSNTWYNAILGASLGQAPYEGIWTSGRYWQLRPKELIPSGITGIQIVQ